jgi:FkbM family methyltransferase
MIKKKIRHELYKTVYSSYFITKKLINKSTVKSVFIDSKDIIISFKDNIKFVLKQSDVRQTHLEALSFGDYENRIISLISKILGNKKKIFFDIGANNGFVSLKVKKNCKNISTYCFEPNKYLFEELKTNLKINDFKKGKIFNFGFTNKTKKQNLYLDDNGYIGASLSKSIRSEKFISCKFTTLDKFVSKENKIPHLIKCDVEGAELLVLRGGLNIIKKYKPVLVLEILRKWTKNFNYNSNDIINFLSSLNYECFKISDKNIKKILKIDKQTVETNFLFINKLHSKKLFNQIKNI